MNNEQNHKILLQDLLTLASATNQKFLEGSQLHKQWLQTSQQYELLKQFDNSHSIRKKMTSYCLLLIAELGFSGFFIILLLEEIITAQNFWYICPIVIAMYGVLVYFASSMAAHFIFADSPELMQLKKQLELYANHPLNKGISNNESWRSAKKNKPYGYLIAILFISILLFLGFYRNYLTNGSKNWVSIDSPDDVTLLIIPILLGILLIWRAKFKSIYFQFIQQKKELNKLDEDISFIQKTVIELDHKCFELIQAMKQHRMKIPNSAEIRTTLNRFKSQSSADPNYFARPQLCSIRLFLSQGNEPYTRAIVLATAADDLIYSVQTDNEGMAVIQWEAFSNQAYIKSIHINEQPVSGSHFINGSFYAFDIPTEEAILLNEAEKELYHSNGQH